MPRLPMHVRKQGYVNLRIACQQIYLAEPATLHKEASVATREAAKAISRHKDSSECLRQLV